MLLAQGAGTPPPRVRLRQRGGQKRRPKGEVRASAVPANRAAIRAAAAGAVASRGTRANWRRRTSSSGANPSTKPTAPAVMPPIFAAGQRARTCWRSGVALADKHGELVGEATGKHSPALTLATADSVAIAEYIHSVHATAMSGPGSPPGRNPTNVELNVLVGDAKAGASAFGTCARHVTR